MSFVQSLADFENCCEFSKLQDGQMIDAQKQTKALLLAMAVELHPLRFELQIWLSCLPWAPKQTHIASSLEIQMGILQS